MNHTAKKSILLIGADKHVLRACGELSVDVTVVYGRSAKEFGLHPIAPEVTQLFVEDQHSLESILSALTRSGIDGRAFSSVYTSDEGAVVTASALALHFGIRSMAMDTAINFRDKAVQKSILRSAGVPVADFRAIDDISELCEDFKFPFSEAVIKPVAGAGASATAKVCSTRELLQFAKKFRPGGHPQRSFVLEEFMRGQEWQINGVVHDDHVIFMSVSTYGETCLTALNGNRPMRVSVLDPVVNSWAYERSASLVQDSLRALGLKSGVFHMELFYDRDSDRLVFGECAARRGGAITQEEVAYKFGVSLAACAVQSALGEAPVIHQEVQPGSVGSAFLPIIPGTLFACPTVEDLQALPDVRFARIDLPIGFRMSESLGSTLIKAGQVMIHAESDEAVEKRIEYVLDWFLSQIVAIPNDASPAELRSWGEGLTSAT
ncbi:hypothetical protein AB0469_38110 [Streptomyces sp. NPDC093801]|uniref:ATP-grasp domain-containing protein n=1 Tax=Streptomyces sp. NPDC093801 TaxID=3155203 RepID=UPI00344EC351